MKKILIGIIISVILTPSTLAVGGIDSALDSVSGAVDSVGTAISDAANSAGKIADINKKYDELIQATQSRRTILEQEAQNCSGDTYCAESARLRVQANQSYELYLSAQKDYEIAKYNYDRACAAGAEGCNPEVLSAAQEARNAVGQQVRGILQQLETRDRTRNQSATFDASGVFSLAGQENRERRSFLQFANTIADWMITLVSSLAVTALIIGGFLMIISGGDENRLETGKTIFTYSLIGLVVTLLGYGIISFIQSIFYLGSA